MRRHGYGLGWDLAEYDGLQVVARSGGYDGCRSMILFAPEKNIGVAVLSLGDAGVNTFNDAVYLAALDVWGGRTDAATRSEARLRAYELAAAEAFRTADAPDPRLARVAPLNLETAVSAIGTYANARLGSLTLTREDTGLVLRSDALVEDLLPLGTDDFLARQRGHFGLETLRLIRDGDGRVVALLADDDRYDRIQRDPSDRAPSASTAIGRHAGVGQPQARGRRPGLPETSIGIPPRGYHQPPMRSHRGAATSTIRLPMSIVQPSWNAP
jgi:hypothetical protein